MNDFDIDLMWDNCDLDIEIPDNDPDGFEGLADLACETEYASA